MWFRDFLGLPRVWIILGLNVLEPEETLALQRSLGNCCPTTGPETSSSHFWLTIINHATMINHSDPHATSSTICCGSLLAIINLIPFAGLTACFGTRRPPSYPDAIEVLLENGDRRRGQVLPRLGSARCTSQLLLVFQLERTVSQTKIGVFHLMKVQLRVDDPSQMRVP